jgi:hypothetical protein
MLENPLPPSGGETRIELDLLQQAREYLHIWKENGKLDEAWIQAWADFFQLEDQHLRRWVCKTKAPKDQRDDVVQEVWREIADKGLDGFQGDRAVQQLHCWMHALLRTQAARIIRRLAARPTKSLSDEFADPEDRDERESSEREYRQRVWDLFYEWLNPLEKKEPLNYELMRGRLIEERRVIDLAAATNLSQDAVTARIKRLTGRFRVWLTRRREGEGSMRNAEYKNFDI